MSLLHLSRTHMFALLAVLVLVVRGSEFGIFRLVVSRFRVDVLIFLRV